MESLRRLLPSTRNPNPLWLGEKVTWTQMHRQRLHKKRFSSAKGERLLRAHCRNASVMQRLATHKEMIEQDRVRSLCDINRELRGTRRFLSEIKAISGHCHEARPNYLLPGADFTASLNNSGHNLCNTVKLYRSINNMPELESKFVRLAPFNEPWRESGVMDSGQPSDGGKAHLRKENTSGKRRYTTSEEGTSRSEISARQHFTDLRKCTLLTKDASAIGEVTGHGSGKELNQNERLPHRLPSLPFLMENAESGFTVTTGEMCPASAPGSVTGDRDEPRLHHAALSVLPAVPPAFRGLSAAAHAAWGHGLYSRANAPDARGYSGNERVRQSEPEKDECIPWMLKGAPCAVCGTRDSAPHRAVMSKATVKGSLKQLVLGYNQPSSRSLQRDKQDALRARVSAFVQELE